MADNKSTVPSAQCICHAEDSFLVPQKYLGWFLFLNEGNISYLITFAFSKVLGEDSVQHVENVEEWKTMERQGCVPLHSRNHSLLNRESINL